MDAFGERQGAVAAKSDERLGETATPRPKSVREYLDERDYGGLYQRSDDEMMKIWRTAVEETRALLGVDWD